MTEPDRADEIAREIAMLSLVIHPDRHEDIASERGYLADAIAAALRSYGRTCRYEGLEEAAAFCMSGIPPAQIARRIRSLKSKPESKEPTR